jgi:phosphoserine phosphatase RsbX
VTPPGPRTSGPCLAWSSAGRALPGESVSGDQAAYVPLDDGAVVTVVDGLGHGPEAAVAAAGAVSEVEAAARAAAGVGGVALDAVLSTAHTRLRRTRGAAVTIAAIGCDGSMRWVGVGNVEAHLMRTDGRRAQRVASAVLYGGVVGYRLPRLRVSTVDLAPGDLIVLATDGIDVDFTERVLPVDPPDRVVEGILARYARPNDDALVAAVRYNGPPASAIEASAHE